MNNSRKEEVRAAQIFGIYVNSNGAVVRNTIPMLLSQDWLQQNELNPALMCYLEISNSRMSATLSRGDLAFINLADVQAADGAIMLGFSEGELDIFRMAREDSQWFLCCDSLTESAKYAAPADLVLIGRVVTKMTPIS